MFKKKGQSSGGSILADRMKAIAGPYVPVEHQYVDTHIRGEKRPVREPVYKHATVQLRGGERLAVVLKNVSETGARIEFFRNVSLSDAVYLTEPTLKLRTWCYVVWEGDGVAGLHFVNTDSPTDTDSSQSE